MKIIISGINGYVGSTLAFQLLKNNNIEIIGLGTNNNCIISHARLTYFSLNLGKDDLSNLKKFKADVFFHLAANSNADFCEQFSDIAFQTNVSGTLDIIEFCNHTNCKLVFLSSDFVFGYNEFPVKTNHPTSPVNYYGETKKISEKNILNYSNLFEILRISLVWGPSYSNKNNLYSWLEKSIENNEFISINENQKRNLIFIDDLIFCLENFLNLKAQNQIWHVCGNEILSPFEFLNTLIIFKKSSYLNYKKVNLEEVVTIAKRPLQPIMDNIKSKKIIGLNSKGLIENFKKINLKTNIINFHLKEKGF